MYPVSPIGCSSGSHICNPTTVNERWHVVNGVKAIGATVASVAFLFAFGRHALASEPLAIAGTDCPSAHAQYSSKTVLMDLLINPATRSILAKNLPDLLVDLPELVTSTTPPSFSAIFTVESVAKFKKMVISTAAMKKLDTDLANVPMTQASALARCARYDEGPSGLPTSVHRPSVLVFAKVNGYRDLDAINAAAAALRTIGAEKGWTMVYTENGAAMNDADLSHFAVVVWNNVSGDVLTIAQRDAFRRYVEHGGGFAAFHGSGGDSLYDWGWYADNLIGARFIGHPRSFHAAAVVIDDPNAWVAQGLPSNWNMTEEWYSFKTSPRLSGAHILARLDESTYGPDSNLTMGDHPIAWSKCVDDGRAFYSAIGHRPENYSEPNARLLLERGIAWAANQGSTHCRSGSEVSRPH